VYEKEGNITGAEKEYNRLFEKYPKSEELKTDIVLFYIRTRQIAGAEKFLQKLVEKFPANYKDRMMQLKFLQDWSDKSRMVDTLDGMILDFPLYFEPVKLKAAYFSEINQIDSALAVVEEFAGRVSTGPLHLKAQNLRSQILWQAGREVEALELVENVLDKNPGDFQANTLKGDILKSQKDYAGAVAAYRIVLREQPGHIPTIFKIGDAQRLSRQFLLAAESYKDVLEKDPNHSEARLGLAKIYKQLGKHENAIKELKFLLEKNPENEEAATLLEEVSIEKDK
jgi:tetratricopeptide (TPR) repeat protein